MIEERSPRSSRKRIWWWIAGVGIAVGVGALVLVFSSRFGVDPRLVDALVAHARGEKLSADEPEEEAGGDAKPAATADGAEPAAAANGTEPVAAADKS